tara:strand:- start:718 stop:2409 length:1692 start_codon:yes stop_codon:yes gene_type:complete
MEFTAKISRGNYQEWEFVNKSTNSIESIDVNPLLKKLFNDDEFTLQNKNVKINKSRVRNVPIPGVLVLDKDKKYGMYKNKYLYKCIPDDIQIPMFLIPYNPNNIGFHKKMYNKYILFKYNNWDGKHPMGTIMEIFGDVNVVDNFYTYQLYCKNIFISKKKLDKQVIKKIKLYTIENHIQNIRKKYKIEDCTRVNNIYSCDPIGCEDVDDAFSIDKLENGYKLTIYIANVPLWLDYLNVWDSLTNQMATIYLPEKKRTMLPNVLSNNVCSLLVGEKKISFALTFHLNQDYDIISYNFSNKMICVKKNFSYDNFLTEYSCYNELMEMIYSMNKKNNYVSEILDGHDIIEYMMILMNTTCAKELIKHKNGIFRSLTLDKNVNTNKYDKNINKFLTMLKNNNCKYCDFKNAKPHDLMGLDLYCHITSPIRRMVDIVNMLLLAQNLNLIQETQSNLSFKDKMMYSIEDINKCMTSIKRVQNDFNLLDTCVKDDRIKEKVFKGFIFDVEKYHDNYKYQVYIPKLHMVNKYITSNKDIELMKSYNFRIYMFMDSIRLKQKIMLQRCYIIK